MIMVLRKLAMELASGKMQIYINYFKISNIIFDYLFIYHCTNFLISIIKELMEKSTPLIIICIRFH